MWPFHLCGPCVELETMDDEQWSLQDRFLHHLDRECKLSDREIIVKPLCGLCSGKMEHPHVRRRRSDL